MAIDSQITGGGEPSRDELRRYNVTIPLGSISIGVDNIHHDVFLSPKFVQQSREYLFELIRQAVANTYLAGIEMRAGRGPDHSAFRKLATDMLQSSLTQAKHHKNIEIDLLFRLAILKFLINESFNQFANVILDGKEYIRKRGEYFERSQQAHVIKARLSEMQSARRNILRGIGQQVCQILVDIEENLLQKSRKALFGDDFAAYYEMLKNRLVFLDGGKDDFFFLDHYVLLGNYAKDPDRLEAIDALFQELLRSAGVAEASPKAASGESKGYRQVLSREASLRAKIAECEEQRETLRKKLERGDGLFNKLLSSSDPAEVRISLHSVEQQLRGLQAELETAAPELDHARHEADFAKRDAASQMDEYLNEPENARRLFDPSYGREAERTMRSQRLSQLTENLEKQEILHQIFAGYEIRVLAAHYCPPVHLQQLRKAIVSKDEAKRVEEILRQFSARRLSMKPIEELSKKVRKYSKDETQAFVLRFAQDFFRLRRDLRDSEHLTSCMERINLITAEKVRELSRLNNRLYECLLKEEARPEDDQVISHVIIKADVRGSTKMTQDLLSRGLSPASHFSLNLHEPVKRLLDRYAAKKVFIEGDAIVLAIFETEHTQAYARPVAKACVLSRHILGVCNSYNDHASSSELPALEIGIGVAFQGSAPTYWTDGESRIMISKALNLSDRLSGCTKLAKRKLSGQKTLFCVYQFLTAMEGASAEELDEFLVRFNMNGIELNEEGFKKLSEEISLEKITTTLDMPWGKEETTLYHGEVPMGESNELLVLRESVARQMLPDGTIGQTCEHSYYEVCTTPALYELVGSLLRARAATMEPARV